MRTLRSGKPLPDTKVIRNKLTGQPIKTVSDSESSINETEMMMDIGEGHSMTPDPPAQIDNNNTTSHPEESETGINQESFQTPTLNQSNVEFSASKTQEEVNPTPVKRGRGRPKKNSIGVQLPIPQVKLVKLQVSQDNVKSKPEDEIIQKKQQEESSEECRASENVEPPKNGENYETAKTESVKVTTKGSDNVVEKTTATPRRSLRAPKPKAAPIVSATMAVERDANPEICNVCGEEFKRKSLLLKHMKNHAQADVDVEIEQFMLSPKNKEQHQSLLPSPSGQKSPSSMLSTSLNPVMQSPTPSSSSKLSPMKYGSPMSLSSSSSPSRQRLFPVTCDVCSMNFTRRAHLNRHMLIHTGIKPFTCDICKIRFTRKDHMLAHKQKHEKIHRIQCAQCGTGFLSWKVLQEHIKSVHSTFKTATPGRPRSVLPVTAAISSISGGIANDTGTGENICDLCGKKFLQKRYLRAHKRLHMRKEAQLLAQLKMADAQINEDNGEMMMEEDYEDEMMLLDQMDQAEHDAELPNFKTEPTASSTSGTLFQTKMMMANNEENGGSDSEDDYNDDEFEQLIDYDYEAMMQQQQMFGTMEEESNDGNINDDDDDTMNNSGMMECSVCGEQYSERGELRKHYKTHNRMFICRFCGLQLASAGSLMRHNLTHTGKKQFNCKICSRKFSRKDTLMVHLQAHEKSSTRINMPKPFGCRICGASYTMKYNLIRHIRMCHGGTATVENRATILKKIEQKYQNGINNFTSNKYDEEQNEIDQEEKLLSSVECEITSEPEDGLIDDNGESSKETPAEKSPTEQELQQCEQDELKPEEVEAEPNNDETKVEKFICYHCGKIFKNAKSLNTHKWYHSRDKQFVCPICARGFKYSTDLGRHISTHGDGLGAPRIKQIKKIPETSTAPTATTVTEEPKINQEQDNTTQDNLVLNEQLSRVNQNGLKTINLMDTRPFACKICPQRFNHRSNLSRHVRIIHKGIKPGQGQVQGHNLQMQVIPGGNLQNYLKQRQLQQQMSRVRMGQHQVGNSSITQTSIQRAISNQSRQQQPNFGGGSQVLTPESYTYDPTLIRPFICNYCGKDFENKNNIWTHMRIHNKMFQCEYCNLKVATRGDLILHLRTHTGEKPFGCNMCDWRFSRKSGLNKHIEKYHGPGAKQLRTFSENSPFTRRLHNSGMEISTISSMGNGSRNFMPQQRNQMHIIRNGLTITRTTANNNGGKLSYMATRFVCRICQHVMIGKDNYIRHVEAHHIETAKEKERRALAGEDIQETKQEEIKKEVFGCKDLECNGRFTSQQELTIHVKTHTNTNSYNSDSARCIYCAKIFTSLRYLQKHYETKHSTQPNPVNRKVEPRENLKSIQEAKGKGRKKSSAKKSKQSEPEESSEDSLPEESDDPPNLVKVDKNNPFPEPISDDNYEGEEIDELQYAPMNFNKPKFQSVQPNNFSGFILPCERCGKEFGNKKARADHIWYCKRSKMYTCPVMECRKEFKLKHDVTRHLRRHTMDRRFPCRISNCRARFLHKKDAHRHMKAIHNFAVQSRAFPCDFCNCHYATELELSEHTQKVHGLELADIYDDLDAQLSNNNQSLQYDEGYAQFLLDNNETMMDEEEDVPDPTSFLEQSMGEITQSSIPPISATSTINDEDYSCKICNKTFPSRQKWLYHRYYHVREEKYDCNQCEEKFKLRSHLERHIRTYHNEDKPVYNILNCNQCPRKFTREYDLTTHIQKTHSKPPQEQEQQMMVFKTKGIAPKRQLPMFRPSMPSTSASSGTARTPVVAAKVIQNRNSWPPINRMGTSSTIVKPTMGNRNIELGPDGWYSCKLCGKTFDDKKYAEAHSYYHNRESKHICSHCGAKFKQSSDLQRHMRIHHSSDNPNKNPMHCPHCRRSFTDLRYLRTHMKMYHNQSSGGDMSSDQYSEVEAMNEDFEINPIYPDDEVEDKDQKNMEEIEYLQYQSELQANNDNENNDGLQLTITCEGCGMEIQALSIADHNCSSPDNSINEEKEILNTETNPPVQAPFEMEVEGIQENREDLDPNAIKDKEGIQITEENDLKENQNERKFSKSSAQDADESEENEAQNDATNGADKNSE